jgi:hypothetical protein
MAHFISENDTQILDPKLLEIKTKIIDKLPEELVLKIYKKYLEADVYYTIYTNIIKDPISKGLSGELLIPFISIVFSKPIVCKYIREMCPRFCSSFEQHKIKNKKQYHLMLNGQSFAATILLSLYH